MADLAEKYHFSESYISRKIKKETGYTFVDILNGIRLMCAASLLKTGEKISDVCEKQDLMTSIIFHNCLRKHLDVHRRITEVKAEKLSRGFMKF